MLCLLFLCVLNHTVARLQTGILAVSRALSEKSGPVLCIGLHDLSRRFMGPCKVLKQRNSGAEEFRKDKKGSVWVLGSAYRVNGSGQDRVKGVVPAEEAERTGKEIPQRMQQ